MNVKSLDNEVVLSEDLCAWFSANSEVSCTVIRLIAQLLGGALATDVNAIDNAIVS